MQRIAPVFAQCSAGKRVIGGGGEIVHGNGRVAFESLTPADLPGVETEFIAFQGRTHNPSDPINNRERMRLWVDWVKRHMPESTLP